MFKLSGFRSKLFDSKLTKKSDPKKKSAKTLVIVPAIIF